MHLLAAINNNVDEWEALQHFDKAKPRLPLPYVFGGSFLMAGHTLSAIDLYSMADKRNISPFKSLYYKNKLGSVLEEVDIAALWGSDALMAILKQSLTPWSKKNILYFTYVFAPEHSGRKQQFLDLSIRILAKAAKGLVVMTVEQEKKALEILGNSIPVIRLRCGIDTSFYRVPSSLADIPEKYQKLIESLLSEPYVIMPGDELRFNDDAIRFVEKSGIRLVRVSQYGQKSGTEKFKQNIEECNISERVIVLEKIGYPFLRFLFQHASAYAGLVDSTWQPAGWTVACEALSSGLPMILYEGLVSRELAEVDVPVQLVQHVPMGDVTSFTEKLSSLVDLNQQGNLSQQAISFSSKHLDFETTAPPFVEKIEQLMESKV